MLKKCFSIGLFCILSLSAFSSLALGKLGHKVTCELAFDLLSEQAKSQLTVLLSALPLEEQHNINRYNKHSLNKNISFAESCTWPDAIKHKKQYQQFKSWHYINVDRTSSIVKNNACQKGCVTSAITIHTKQLKNAHNREEKLNAIMFLGHWLGDIHQPLHVSFASDYGGNKNKITPFIGKCNNLHWYWDECLLLPTNKTFGKAFNYKEVQETLYSTLKAKMTQENVKKWQQSDITTWANESYSLITDKAFNYCNRTNENNHAITHGSHKTNTETPACQSTSHSVITITEDYHKKYQPILHQRIMQAAARLSLLLEQNL